MLFVFTKRFGLLPDGVALDLNDRSRGWKLGIPAPIAKVPAECFEPVDGVIVY